MNRLQPIGLFDSGIGGLTVVKEIKRLLPEERLVYFGDTARVPYGSKSRSTIQRYTRENARLLIAHGVKMIVVACNTSSAVAIDFVRQEFDGPVLDVVAPGVTAALNATRNAKVGIIATPRTIESQAYQLGIQKERPEVLTYSKACPLLVPLAEEGWADTEAARLIVQEYLRPLLEHDIDTLVMGCTHYPLLEKVLQSVAGQNVQLVSSARETARGVLAILEDTQMLSPERPGRDLYLASDAIDTFRDFYERIVQNASEADFRLASSAADI